MMVKCQICGTKIDRDVAYKVQHNNRNKYYCSEKEYQQQQQELRDKDILFTLINTLFGYKVINSALFKEIANIHTSYSYSQITSYIQSNKNLLSSVLNKDYNNEDCKIIFFFTIVSNNIKDFVTNYRPQINRDVSIEITKTKYKHKKRKSLSDYEGCDID